MLRLNSSSEASIFFNPVKHYQFYLSIENTVQNPKRIEVNRNEHLYNRYFLLS